MGCLTCFEAFEQLNIYINLLHVYLLTGFVWTYFLVSLETLEKFCCAALFFHLWDLDNFFLKSSFHPSRDLEKFYFEYS